jgi:hypothetical protein
MLTDPFRLVEEIPPEVTKAKGELEKFEISFKIEARKRILPQAYNRYSEDKM